MTAEISSESTKEAQHQADPVSSSSIRASSRKNRVYVLRDFLRETYKEYLKPGSIVLDVAGGKGDLSWLLHNVDDINSIVMDPRITMHRHILRSVEYLRRNPEECRKRSIRGLPTHQPLAELIHVLDQKEALSEPHHIRILVDDDLVSAIRHYKDRKDLAAWGDFWRMARQKGQEVQPLGYQETRDESERALDDAQIVLDSILNASLIVGFHPDQATGACFELASVLQIPVCVVPCCVFPREFPDRHLRSGSFVRCYEDLITYFVERYPALRRAQLQFHETETARKNTLYILPGENLY